MKKRFNLYIVVWIALFLLFNIISFVSVGWSGYEKCTYSFWMGYALISIMFISQLICSYIALKDDNAKKLFYNISLIKISYSNLIISFIAGGLCMIISPLPYWIGVIVCVIVLLLNVISLIKATYAINEIERIDIKVKTQTNFIKTLTIESDALMKSAKSDIVKKECRKVYEAIRYSDPMSNEGLVSVESMITEKFAEFSNMVEDDNKESVTILANKLIALIDERNKKCKFLKLG